MTKHMRRMAIGAAAGGLVALAITATAQADTNESPAPPQPQQDAPQPNQTRDPGEGVAAANTFVMTTSGDPVSGATEDCSARGMTFGRIISTETKSGGVVEITYTCVQG